jgi:hypothetical protein
MRRSWEEGRSSERNKERTKKKIPFLFNFFFFPLLSETERDRDGESERDNLRGERDPILFPLSLLSSPFALLFCFSPREIKRQREK